MGDFKKSILNHRVAAGMLVACGVILALLVTTHFIHAAREQPITSTQNFANLTAAVSNFQPYTFHILDGFAIQNSTLTYSQGVLIFQLRNQYAQSVAVTEQLLPESVANNVDPNATPVAGVDGHAIITYNGTSTTAALFSGEHHGRRTMVLLNTTDPLPQSTIEDLLRGLRPATN